MFFFNFDFISLGTMLLVLGGWAWRSWRWWWRSLGRRRPTLGSKTWSRYGNDFEIVKGNRFKNWCLPLVFIPCQKKVLSGKEGVVGLVGGGRIFYASMTTERSRSWNGFLLLMLSKTIFGKLKKQTCVDLWKVVINNLFRRFFKSWTFLVVFCTPIHCVLKRGLLLMLLLLLLLYAQISMAELPHHNKKSWSVLKLFILSPLSLFPLETKTVCMQELKVSAVFSVPFRVWKKIIVFIFNRLDLITRDSLTVFIRCVSVFNNR